MKFLRILFIAILIFSFDACNNSDELPKGNRELLTQKLWAFQSLSGFDFIVNQYASSFLIGSTYQFREDGTFTVNALGASISSNWEFNPDQTIIIMQPGTVQELRWNINTLNETVLSVSFDDLDAVSGTATMTFI